MIQFAAPALEAALKRAPAAAPAPALPPTSTPGHERTASAHREETERIGDEIAELAAHLHAATYRLLELLRAFDAREGWGDGGHRSCAHWLSWRTGIALGAAREKVRVARALAVLPRISDAMQRGELSFSKVRALTRVATPGSEAELLAFARSATASQLERLVRAWRRVDRLEDAETDRLRHEARYLTLYPDDDGMYELHGRLDPEVGALLAKALEWAAEVVHGRTADADLSAGQRRADAIGHLAACALAGDGSACRAERYQVVVHVDAEALAAGSSDGHAVLADSGQRVSAETSRRTSCDAGLVALRHDGSGGVLDVGRRTRTVSSAIRRALEHRDRVCRFPGCESRFCDAHHIRHWADGGQTRLDNLILLCRTHHRLVHEGGFGVEADTVGTTRFRAPAGWLVPDAPPLAVAEGAIARLRRDNASTAPDIHAWTAAPVQTWGDRFDLDWSLMVLRQ